MRGEAAPRHSLLMLTGGLLASLLANGRFLLWPAAWIGGLLLVRYFRSASGWRPWLFAALGFFATGCIAWFGLMPFPPTVFLNIQAQTAVLALLPFALDRLTCVRDRAAWWQTLVFPLSATGLAWIGYLRSGTTWGALGYTQVSFLPLAQLASVTGIWGVGFVVSWSASWGNTAWEEWRAGRRLRRSAFVYPAVLTLVVLGGTWRLASAPSATTSPIAVASVTPPDLLDILTPEDLGLLQARYMKREVPAEALERVTGALEASEPELLETTRREARAGARFVLWPEASVIAFGSDRREALLETLAALADQEDIYLGASVAYVPDDPAEPNQNAILVFGPDGRLAGEYHKTRLVPEVEEPFTRPGTGAISRVDTPLGRIGLAICYDLDDPGFVAGLAGSGVDVLFAPSGDWGAIKHLHAAMARFRSIEVGVPLFRPANHGLSQAVDTRGRVIASMDHDAAADRVLRSTLEPGMVETPYARWGDAFAWLCVLAWPAVVAIHGRRARRTRAIRVATAQ